MTARHLASKFKRAIRNDTGTHFTADELRLLGSYGLMDILIEQESREYREKWAGPSNDYTPLGASGSLNENSHPSIKSAGMTREQRRHAAKALAAGI